VTITYRYRLGYIVNGLGPQRRTLAAAAKQAGSRLTPDVRRAVRELRRLRRRSSWDAHTARGGWALLVISSGDFTRSVGATLTSAVRRVCG
jgi:hypothetical protein